jgi:hypothetical protein
VARHRGKLAPAYRPRPRGKARGLSPAAFKNGPRTSRTVRIPPSRRRGGHQWHRGIGRAAWMLAGLVARRPGDLRRRRGPALARSERRRRDLGVRLALGATPGRSCGARSSRAFPRGGGRRARRPSRGSAPSAPFGPARLGSPFSSTRPRRSCPSTCSPSLSFSASRRPSSSASRPRSRPAASPMSLCGRGPGNFRAVCIPLEAT